MKKIFANDMNVNGFISNKFQKLWKILKEMGIPDHLNCLLWNLYAGQVKKQQLEPDMEQQTGSKLGKEYANTVYCHIAYLTYKQSTSCEMPGWMKHKPESRFLGEISVISDADDATIMVESEKELKSLLMKVKEESEKAGLILNIQKTEIMASGPITSWQIKGPTVRDFIFLGSKITAMVTAAMKLKDACSLEEKLWPI